MVISFETKNGDQIEDQHADNITLLFFLNSFRSVPFSLFR